MSQMPNAKFDFIDFRFAGNLLDTSHPVEKNWKLQGLPEIRPIVRRNSSYKWTFLGTPSGVEVIDQLYKS